jgi:hypothetical protein
MRIKNGAICLLLALTASGLWVHGGEAKGNNVYQAPDPEPTPEETLMLEYMNRLRADPPADAERIAPGSQQVKAGGFMGQGVDWNMFRSEMKALKAAPPVVFNLKLLDSARKHSHYMILNGLTHGESPDKPGFTGTSHVARAKAAGYNGAYSENCFAGAGNPWHAHAGFVVDFGAGPGGMQQGRGHRMNMVNGGVREIGLAGVPRKEGGLSVTHVFGHAKTRFAGGVMYVDKNKNGFYDLDEGVGDVTISAKDGETLKSWKSGAFALPLPGEGEVTVSAEFMGIAYSQTFPAGKGNVKFDWRIPSPEDLKKADALIAAAEKAGGAEDPKAFKALVSLYQEAPKLSVDDARNQKIKALTAGVEPKIKEHQTAVLDALQKEDWAGVPRLVATHKQAFRGTDLEGWFDQALAVEQAARLVLSLEKRAKTAAMTGMAKPDPALTVKEIERLKSTVADDRLLVLLEAQKSKLAN